jgi:hypothetical protein
MEGCRFSTGWCTREPYWLLLSAVSNATIPTFAVLLRFTLSFVYKVYIWLSSRVRDSGLEKAGCQWPKAGHILEMAGKKKFELLSEWQVKFYRYISFHLLTTTHIY